MKTLMNICIAAILVLPAISAQIINSGNGGTSGTGYGVNIGLGVQSNKISCQDP